MVCGPASAWAIGGIAAAPWVRSTSRKSGSVAYLSRIASAIAPCAPRASVAWRRSVASPKSPKTTSAASGPAFFRARSPGFALLDDQPQALRAAADRLDQPGRGHVSQVPGHRLGPVGSQQLVEIVGVDPREDQGLIEGQGIPERLEDRPVQADQGEAFQALAAERLQGHRAEVVERPQGGAQVRRPSIQADEAQDRQGVAQRRPVVRQALDQGGDARRIGEDQGQRGRIPRRGPPLRRRQAGQLGDQDAPVRLVAPLQSEILAPVQQHVGRGVGAQDVAEPVELDGILLVEEQGLHVELVEQDQPALAVGPVDRLGVPAESLRQPRHHLAHPRRSGPVARQHRIRPPRPGAARMTASGSTAPTGDSIARSARPIRPGRLGRQLDQHPEGGQERHYGEGSLHHVSRSTAGRHTRRRPRSAPSNGHRLCRTSLSTILMKKSAAPRFDLGRIRRPICTENRQFPPAWADGQERATISIRALLMVCSVKNE